MDNPETLAQYSTLRQVINYTTFDMPCSQKYEDHAYI